MSSQEVFLARVRHALHTDHAPEAHQAVSPVSDLERPETIQALRSRLREQAPALVTRLQEELSAVGGMVSRVESIAEVTQYITQLAQEKEAALVVRWPSALLEVLEIDAALQYQGIDSRSTTPLSAREAEAGEAALEARRQELRDLLARADIGLSGVDYAIAETGTLVLSALPGQMRGVSLLPPVHIAVVRREQIIATMAEYLSLLSAEGADLQQSLTSCISCITGPSRTGDVELSLTIGVHGPGELHLVILDEPETLRDGAE